MIASQVKNYSVNSSYPLQTGFQEEDMAQSRDISD